VAAHPATVLALVVSDVVGDDLDVIASGPTVPDPTTFAEARDVLARFGLWDEVPASVRERLSGDDGETPKPGDARFERATTCLLGTNRTALEAAQGAAEDLGYVARIVRDTVTGEAREVARELVKQALTVDVDGPTCLLWGGETTVTVTGSGTGGRNQELALAAALGLDSADRDVVLLSGGTDGIDGPTDAAGAWATPQTAARARRQGLDPQAFLGDNDAYAFFDHLGQLLRPGPTHTNVMDVQVALLRG
jgi:hydroxypyruvate reductase